ncbi:TIGR02450 family Trp-rich protein [Crenobacter sp. SG2303]|uniref:TIGR02450 family Trp-rich protein n=1 Tax=Crenobacter oryzisoli TaxID=3056844 RepID=A0ABT7XSX2_9NEIS|nr:MULTISPECIES: TIGR02450 family Trp-rich protein [unclassified Crenobacter]MDN0076823.1 TIGR02450 family Trp-rich protein [Crenobacter sp. SG2303]MDN0084970.1 TIGR02450 family Trp-rich protein [Crenobacter sp. SG2305]
MPLRRNPRKLLLSKWTAVQPRNKEKHFIVTRLLQPEDPAQPLTEVELEAVYSRRSQVIAWQTLTDAKLWRQGWH